MEIALASKNINKCAEIKSVAKNFNIQILTLNEVAEKLSLEPLDDIEETGLTYEENAFIKANKCFSWCGLPSIGDDSGLEVEILGGAPGIYSARFAGENSSDSDKITKLLNEISKISSNENRNARFISILCYISDSNTKELYFDGVLEGTVLHTPRGTNGFGYDPIIHINSLGKTLAECSKETVCSEGFRAKAAKKLFSFILNNK